MAIPVGSPRAVAAEADLIPEGEATTGLKAVHDARFYAHKAVTIYPRSGTPTFSVDILTATIDADAAFTVLSDGTTVAAAKTVTIPEGHTHIRVRVNSLTGGTVGARLACQQG